MNRLHNMKLVGLLLILILASCTSIQKDEKEKGPILHIPIEKDDGIMHINADSIFESVEYIPLETTEENLLSGMEYLSTKVYNDTIYIWDRNLQQLIQYDGKGKYLKKLSRRGNGPGEYIKVWDFLVLDTTVCLLSDANKKIIFYRKSDFTYLYSVPIPVTAVQMSKYGKFLYLFSGNWSPEKFNIYVMDIETGEVISRYHEFTSVRPLIERPHIIITLCNMTIIFMKRNLLEIELSTRWILERKICLMSNSYRCQIKKKRLS